MQVEKVNVQGAPVIGSEHPMGTGFGPNPYYISNSTYVESNWTYIYEPFQEAFSVPVAVDGYLTCGAAAPNAFTSNAYNSYATAQHHELVRIGGSSFPSPSGTRFDSIYMEVEVAKTAVLPAYSGSGFIDYHRIMFGFMKAFQYFNDVGIFFIVDRHNYSGISSDPYVGDWAVYLSLGSVVRFDYFRKKLVVIEGEPVDGGYDFLHSERAYKAVIPDVTVGDKMRLDYNTQNVGNGGYPVLSGYLNGELVYQLDEDWFSDLYTEALTYYEEYTTDDSWSPFMQLYNTGNIEVDSLGVF